MLLTLPVNADWVLGVDVGQRSLGLCATAIVAGKPVGVHSKVCVHDGGAPNPNSPSRKSAAGAARRCRRTLRRKKYRILAIKKKLEEAGFPVTPSVYRGQDVWEMRSESYRQPIDNIYRRKACVSAATLHIALHRGWRNSWLSYGSFVRAAMQGPTASMQVMWDQAAERWPKLERDFAADETSVGELGALAVLANQGLLAGYKRTSTAIRPRKRDEKTKITENAEKESVIFRSPTDSQLQQLKKSSKKNHSVYNDKNGSVLMKVRAEDQWRELREIYQKQGVPEEVAEQLLSLVFFMEKHPVKKSGKDAIPEQARKGRRRALKSSLEAEEFAILSTVANLRVCGDNGEIRKLSSSEYDVISAYLLEYHESRPNWYSVAREINLSSNEKLRTTSQTGRTSDPAPDRPVLRALRKLQNQDSSADDPVTVQAKKRFFDWCSKNPSWVRHALGSVTDPSHPDDEAVGKPFIVHDDPETHDEQIQNEISALFDGEIGERLCEELNALGLFSGRSAYSRESLHVLTAMMRTHRCDLQEAYGHAGFSPPHLSKLTESLDDPIDHPTIAIVNTEVKRFLMGCVRRFGKLPSRVVVEIVRDGLLTPEGKARLAEEANGRGKYKESVRIALAEANDQSPVTERSIRRWIIRDRHNNECLYCGNPLRAGWEIDHVVASSQGGSNRAANLVASCRQCNESKGNQDTVKWLAEEGAARNLSMEAILGRVATLKKDEGWTHLRFNAYRKELRQRLQMRSGEEPDERSISATAYTAKLMAERIQTWLLSPPADVLGNLDKSLSAEGDSPKVDVFNGYTTSLARKFGKVDSSLSALLHHSAYFTSGASNNLAGQPLASLGGKDRFDRRHHAIDAAVLTMIDAPIAKALAIENRLRKTRYFGSKVKWEQTKDWEVSDQEVETQSHILKWRDSMSELVTLLAEDLQQDRIPVTRPLRLSARVGALHGPNPSPLAKVTLWSGLEAQEVSRIVHPEDFEAVSKQLDVKGHLPPETMRSNSTGKSTIKLHPRQTPSLLINGGSVPLGEAHHARVYRFRSGKKTKYAWVRVFAAEFPLWGWKKETDLFTTELPLDSQAVKHSQAGIKGALLQRKAEQIGWLVSGDELLFPPSKIKSTSKLAELLDLHHIERWVVTGFKSNRQIAIQAAQLSPEGWPRHVRHATTEVQRDRGVKTEMSTKATDPLVWPFSVEQNGIGGRCVIGVSSLLVPGLTVVRRTALGAPRWSAGRANLPTCWSIREE